MGRGDGSQSQKHLFYDPGVSAIPARGGFARNTEQCDQYRVY